MEQKNIVTANDSHIENVGNEVKTFELFSENELCNHLVEKIMSIAPEIREKFQYSIATQGAGVKIPRSGVGDIEITPPKIQLTISPVRYK